MKANTIRLYKHYSEMIENPIGADSQERAMVRKNCMRAKADLEKRFRTAQKYKDDAEIQTLLNPSKPEQVKSEEKKDDKKSKR